MVLVTCLVVIMRYGLDMGSVFLQDVVLYLHGGLFLLGAAFALKRGAHVRVDIFYRDFNIRSKAIVNLVGSVFLLLPLCIVLAYLSMPYVIASWKVLEGSKDGGGLEAVFLLKTAIPLFCFFLGIQAISLALKSYNSLREKS